MPHWEFFSALAEVSGTVAPRWYWRHNKGEISPAFPTLAACIAHAREHGLTDDSIEMVATPTTSPPNRTESP